MSRPDWKPRAEPRVKRPAKPYKHLGARVRNLWTRHEGRIARAVWDGWQWELKVYYDGREPNPITNPMDWITANFWQHHELI